MVCSQIDFGIEELVAEVAVRCCLEVRVGSSEGSWGRRTYNFHSVEASFECAFRGVDMLFNCGCDVREGHLFGCFSGNPPFVCETVVEADVRCG